MQLKWQMSLLATLFPIYYWSRSVNMPSFAYLLRTIQNSFTITKIAQYFSERSRLYVSVQMGSYPWVSQGLVCGGHGGVLHPPSVCPCRPVSAPGELAVGRYHPSAGTPECCPTRNQIPLGLCTPEKYIQNNTNK